MMTSPAALNDVITDLDVEVQYALVVHEGHALADLPHEHHARFLRQDEVVVDDAFKQLATLHPGVTQTRGKSLFLP